MGIRGRGDVIPAGAEMPYHGGTVPPGWLLMFGQVVNIADYPRLFAAIGAVHGGDGVTTFGIPDSRGRQTIGKDDMGGTPANRVTVGNSGINGATLGAVGGGEVVTLTLSQTPAHEHDVARDNIAAADTSRFAATSTFNANKTPTSSKGSGGSHNNMPPSLVANKMIKT